MIRQTPYTVEARYTSTTPASATVLRDMRSIAYKALAINCIEMPQDKLQLSILQRRAVLVMTTGIIKA
ncbi:uncharacterized protein Bfra_007387 [Botrytis fragariae]|uniref:Uncharacterized protein n=1 Tax=Botrytis fragariae TaxID=1964551 RepID=A0A8H6AJ08_9HELO|nr:uncharacterized protein Bfra_007387 [Botrytis fragariae]KAF5868191.1 hypothetical protein Bfra_007387 [Botrytis fragariae]